MAATPPVMARLNPALIDLARDALNLPETAAKGFVIAEALAKVAGVERAMYHRRPGAAGHSKKNDRD